MAAASDESRAVADARLAAALESASIRDPRPYYRHALVQLKQRSPNGYARAVAYFDEQLVPTVAGDGDPLTSWLAYGRMIAGEIGPGCEVEVDPSGRVLAPDVQRPGRGLLLWLPDDEAAPATLLRAPRKWTRAQEATVELLVQGRVTASAYEEPRR